MTCPPDRRPLASGLAFRSAAYAFRPAMPAPQPERSFATTPARWDKTGLAQNASITVTCSQTRTYGIAKSPAPPSFGTMDQLLPWRGGDKIRSWLGAVGIWRTRGWLHSSLLRLSRWQHGPAPPCYANLYLTSTCEDTRGNSGPREPRIVRNPIGELRFA